jgi:hypothetical protein
MGKKIESRTETLTFCICGTYIKLVSIGIRARINCTQACITANVLTEPTIPWHPIKSL